MKVDIINYGLNDGENVLSPMPTYSHTHTHTYTRIKPKACHKYETRYLTKDVNVRKFNLL